jgi:hypothetical protein
MRAITILHEDDPSPISALTDLSDRLVHGTVSDAVLAAVESLGSDPQAGSELVRAARLLSERLGEAAMQLEFALRVIEVGAGIPAAAPASGPDRPRHLEPVAPRRLSPLMERLLKDAAGSAIGDRQAADDDDEFEDIALDGSADLRPLLATLGDFRQTPHIAEKLQSLYPLVKRVPRQKSRGNAALYVLDKFGRTRPLSLGDLVFAFRTMNVIDPSMSDSDARRLVGWEINELRRRKWPIQRIPGEGFRLVDPDGSAM